MDIEEWTFDEIVEIIEEFRRSHKPRPKGEEDNEDRFEFCDKLT
jgi:hypothetical protein